MGSSKKKKEHKRSRSRSQSREKERRKRRHRKEEDDGHRRKSASPVKEKKRRKEEPEREEETIAAPSSSADISMSIEETNKLRAQLGLAPLELNDKAKVKEVQSADGQTTDRVVTIDGKEFVHKPAENWGAKKERESMRDKLQALREKRKLDEKLGEVKLLGDDAEESASAWVAKSKRMEEERRLAELREKMLQEMDEQFGVSEVIEKQKKKAVSKKPADGYGSKDLAGATVQHSKESLLQSKETYLVLADKSVLDDSEDVLINPTITELEKWKDNAELRKKKPGYNPYEDAFDEFGTPKRNLLGKYDEEIDGKKIDSFKLGASGEADLTAEQEREEMLAKLREGAESLEAQPLQLAKEYLTNEEMVKFKKPTKRVRKVRKRVPGLKADDLLAVAKLADEDFGSRMRGRGRKRADYETGVEQKDDVGKVKDEVDETEPMDLSDTVGQEITTDDDAAITLSDDEAEKELQAALSRTRQLQLAQAQEKKVGIEKIVELLPKTEEVEEESTAPDSGRIVMDSVSEYCRGLGDIPTYGLAGNREDVDDDLIDVERPAQASTSRTVDEEAEEEEEEEDEDEVESRGGWYERDINDMDRPKPTRSIRSDSDELSREAILEEEPDMNNMGVGGALKVAVLKGYLKEDKGNRGGDLKLDHLRAQRFTVMDKQFHDIDDKYAKKLERMGGGGGPIVEFREKSDYKPDVKLEYADEKGRLMDEKDAFRYLSWKFHGKAPGKRKVEKRNKKLIEKELFNEMSSTDTPLGTLSKQLEKQRQLQLPFIVLSGTGSKDVGTSIRKE